MADHAPGFLKLVHAAKSQIQETTVDAVKERQDRGESFLLIDCREDREWQAGHLPGATHLGKGIIERDIEKLVPDRSKEIVIYCGGGFRSALAAASLKEMGYPTVISMDGGFRSWKEKGFPVVKPQSK